MKKGQNKKIIILISSIILFIGTLLITLKTVINKPSAESTTAPVCKRASKLHSEMCNQTYGVEFGCNSEGKFNQFISYGNLGTKGELKIGDAFDCDVNSDGEYDAEKERFYYIGQTTGGGGVSNNFHAFVYYNSVSEGKPIDANVINGSKYSSGSSVTTGPDEAIKQLPTSAQWSNTKLRIFEGTTIYDEKRNTVLSNFDYGKRPSRLLRMEDISRINKIELETEGTLTEYSFLIESTEYASFSSKFNYWLEDAESSTSKIFALSVNGLKRSITRASVNTEYAVRPVIEVLQSDISTDLPENEISTYKVTFVATDATLDITSKTVTNGSTYGDLPVPKKNGYAFLGWYTEVTGGTKIDSSTSVQITSDQTLYAHWSQDETIKSSDGSSTITGDSTIINGDNNFEITTVPEEVKNKIGDDLFSDAEDVYVTDLQIKDTDGKEINLNGKEVIVTIPFPNGMSTTDSIKIYEIINGEKKEITFSIDDGKLVLKTSSMGRYAIVKYAENIDVENPKTGDMNLPVLITALVVTSLILIGSIIYIIKTRKNK